MYLFYLLGRMNAPNVHSSKNIYQWSVEKLIHHEIMWVNRIQVIVKCITLIFIVLNNLGVVTYIEWDRDRSRAEKNWEWARLSLAWAITKKLKNLSYKFKFCYGLSLTLVHDCLLINSPLLCDTFTRVRGQVVPCKKVLYDLLEKIKENL